MARSAPTREAGAARESATGPAPDPARIRAADRSGVRCQPVLQTTPLSVKLDGAALLPVWLNWYPKLVLPPTGMEALYAARFAAVTAPLDGVIEAFHAETSACPEGRVKVRCQPLTAVPPVLVMVSWSVAPLFHALTLSATLQPEPLGDDGDELGASRLLDVCCCRGSGAAAYLNLNWRSRSGQGPGGQAFGELRRRDYDHQAGWFGTGIGEPHPLAGGDVGGHACRQGPGLPAG